MSMRDFIEKLDKDGELVRIKTPVSNELEIASVLSTLDGKAVIFDDVRGFETPVVGGVVSSRDLVAKALGCKKEEILQKMVHALNNPKKPEMVEKAPCQEVVEDEVDLDKIPFLLHKEKDGGKYISSAIVVIKDPDLGRNVCYHRMMIIGKDKLVARIVKNRGTDTALQKTKGDLEIAICIGNSVPVLLAASTSLPMGKDEFAMANALGEVKLVKCKTVDLEVPADCELVLEGVMTKEMHDEGPFLDLTETYDGIRKQPIVKIKKITHRKDYIYQALLPGKGEHKMLMGMPKEPTIFDEVNKVVKCKNVAITPGGCSWLHSVIQIEKKNDDDGKKAIEAAFKGHGSMKHCIVVDDDIDLFNMEEVEWAIATRFQADKDLIVMENKPGSSLDPSATNEEGKKTMAAKAGIDATIPSDKDREDFIKTHYKKADLKKYGVE